MSLLRADPTLRAKVDEQVLDRAGDDLPELYRAVFTDGLRDGLKQELYSHSFRQELEPFPRSYLGERFGGTTGGRSRLDWALEADCNFWLPDAQLVKIDVASMAQSVEARSPMLDSALVEYVCGIPHEQKMDRSGKALLKRVARRWLPDTIVDRRKQELAVPLEDWVTTALRPEISRTLISDACLARGYFDPDRLRAFVGRFPAELSYPIWTLYMLEKWHQEFCP